MRRRRRSPVRTALTLILLAVTLTVLVSLGSWQVRRLHWKEALLSEIAERRAMPPVKVEEISALLASGSDVDYRPVELRGTFDHAREQFFFATFNGETGYYVYTPMTIAGGNIVFVNRGFIPYDKKDAALRQAGEVQGDVTVRGLARSRLGGKPSWFVPENDLQKNIFYWKDLDAMAVHAGLDKTRVLQFFVDADATPNPGNMPVGGVTQFDFPNNHLQYAVTWYGLAAVLAVISGVYWRRNRKAR